jgi:hypothetical protein
MSLATISSTTSLGYNPNFQPSDTSNRTKTVAPKEELLSTEQKNTLQNSNDTQIAEQVENIKSNYQSAKDLDLTRAYYQQQQKVIDIYMQTSSGNDTYSSNSDNNTSAISTLTDAYTSLYTLHKNIKDGIQKLPTPYTSISPTNKPDVLPTNSDIATVNKQTDAYNSLMMPSNSSYLHLSA